MCTKTVEEPLLALMSAEPQVVNDVVHRFQVATLAAPAAENAPPSSPSQSASSGLVSINNNPTSGECAQTMTVALSVSLSLAAIVCLVLMFVLGWYCRGARAGTHIIPAKYPVAKGAHADGHAAGRSPRVAVAVLDLESASVPPPPKMEGIAM